MLVGGDQEYQRVMANLSRLERELTGRGVDPRITVEKMLPAASQFVETGARRTISVSTPFGYQGNWSFYEDRNFLVDDDSLYKIDAAWYGSGYDSYPQAPYTITRWDALTGNAIWTYTFDNTLMTVPLEGPCFAQDDSGRLIGFVSDGKTLLLSKDNGSFLTLLDKELGQNLLQRRTIFYTLTSDGIYRYPLLQGRIDKIYSGKIMKEVYARLEGKVHFITWNNGKSIPRPFGSGCSIGKSGASCVGAC